jgi:hypothetical protein
MGKTVHSGKKYVLLSALGHSLLFASIAMPAHAARQPASEQSCQESIDADLAPFRKQVRSIWVSDNLFMYAEVAKIFSHELLDKDPELRAKIEDYKHGKASPTASELQDLLSAKADATSGFADSLSRRFGDQNNYRWFMWHYPVIRVGDRGAAKVMFSLPVGVGSYELAMELGPDSATEDRQLMASAARIVAMRSGVLLPHSSQLSPEFKSERDFLMRSDRAVRESCLVDLWPRYAALDLTLPAHRDAPAVDEPSSRGYWENHWITGYPTSNYAGGGYHTAAAVQSGEAAPAAESPSAPGVSNVAPLETAAPQAPATE